MTTPQRQKSFGLVPCLLLTQEIISELRSTNPLTLGVSQGREKRRGNRGEGKGPSPLTLVLFPGGVLPYITYTGMCRPTGSWFWSSWFRTGYPFQRRFLERGIIFRTHESSSFVSNHLKLFKDKLLLKIRFNALTSKLLYSCCTLERSVKNWPISRTGCQF